MRVSPIVVMAAVILLASLIPSCSTVPKPSEKNDAVVLIQMVRIGTYRGNSHGTYTFSLVDVNIWEVMAKKSLNAGDYLVAIPVPAGGYYIRHRFGDVQYSFRTEEETVGFVTSPGTGQIAIVGSTFSVVMDKTDGGFSMNESWKPMTDANRREIITQLETQKNIESWEIVW